MRLTDWLPTIDHAPEAMTKRARAYMIVVGARHLFVGVAVFIAPQRFSSPSFSALRDTWPLWAWALVSIIVGLIGTYAAVCRRETAARVGLIASATLSGLIAGGLTLAIFASPIAGILGAVIFWAVTAKDLIVCQDPIRSPFEAFTRRELPTGSE